MIKNILFDFGDVFMDLDKEATLRRLGEAGYQEVPEELFPLVISYEKGRIGTSEFIGAVKDFFPKVKKELLIEAWNAIILDFPENRLQFIRNLAAESRFRLFLLSNTNELHIEKVKERMGLKKYKSFKACFEGFYLSHELNMRKPDAEVFKTVLVNHTLNPQETLFVDDTLEHILSAQKLGLKTWHLQVGEEDVLDIQMHL